jgi:hypothetical protein
MSISVQTVSCSSMPSKNSTRVWDASVTRLLNRGVVVRLSAGRFGCGYPLRRRPVKLKSPIKLKAVVLNFFTGWRSKNDTLYSYSYS